MPAPIPMAPHAAASGGAPSRPHYVRPPSHNAHWRGGGRDRGHTVWEQDPPRYDEGSDVVSEGNGYRAGYGGGGGGGQGYSNDYHSHQASYAAAYHHGGHQQRLRPNTAAAHPHHHSRVNLSASRHGSPFRGNSRERRERHYREYVGGGRDGGGGMMYGNQPPPPEYGTAALRRAKKHVAAAGSDGGGEQQVSYSVPPEHIGASALERARREYAADKRMALERRRQRMIAEEGLVQT